MTGASSSNRKARRAARKRGKSAGPSQADIEAMIAAYRAGHLDEAVTSARRFTQRWPKQAVGWNVLAASHQAAGRPAEAVEPYQRALKLEPANADAWNNLGLVLARLGRWDEAERHHARALEQRNRFPEAECNRALALAQLGRADEAEAAFRRALAQRPDFLDVYNELGNLYRSQGRLEDAEAAYRHLLEHRPGRADVRHNLADVLRLQGRLDESIAAFRDALAHAPDHAPIYNGLGLALAAAGRSGEAEGAYRRALTLEPGDRGARLNLARALRDQGRLDEAEQLYRAQLADDAGDIEAWTSLGNLQADQGRLDEAERTYADALERAPSDARLIYYRALIKRFTADDPDIAHIEAELARDTHAPEERACLHYAAAKAYADAGYERASVFAQYAAGARHKRSTLDYDVADDEAQWAALAETLDADRIGALQGEPRSGAAPVFIVGMPRSGTTLVEQILARHPRVYGAGEREDLARLLTQEGYARGEPFPDWLAELDAAEAQALGRRYRETVVEPAGEVDWVTDKMPSNFRYLGLIAAMLPEARIVHLQRDPMDTCWSCFRQLFAGSQAFSYDLTELGRYYRAYAELMDHWRRVLPSVTLLELAYEDLVGDPESQARRLLAHCGLEWDPRCLAFHERAGAVETASAEQVRQPLYGDAVGRWRAYRDHLQPLIEALGPYAPEDPR